MNFESPVEKEEHVSRCLELAILLEVSAYPKPGNIHRTADFKETRYEHFLASAVAVAYHFREAARRGIEVFEGRIGLNDLDIGSIIKSAVKSVSLWQSGGNTLLGSIILLSPIAVAAGMLANESFSLHKLRRYIGIIVKTTTPEDAINVYDAIQIAKPGGLGRSPILDVTDPLSKNKIMDDQTTLLEVFRIASTYDSIASEWINNYPITFELGQPYFAKQLKETRDINTAIVHTFLKILSEFPDTLIARKVGLIRAKKISADARLVLEKGGLATKHGKNLLGEFDKKLRGSENKLSPGTTADITEAVLAISILNGYTP